MGVTERRIREKERKRSTMLDAAESILLEKGLDHLSMEDVAGRAEVSKGSLYQYFQNKNDLVLGICYRATHLLNESFKEVLESNRSGLMLVRELGERYLNYVKDHPQYYSSMKFLDNLHSSGVGGESDYLELCTQNRQEGFRLMVEAIQRGIDDGISVHHVVWCKSSGNPSQQKLLIGSNNFFRSCFFFCNPSLIIISFWI